MSSNGLFQGGALRGALTSKGQQQMYMKGMELRQEYVEQGRFLSPGFDPEEV